MLGLKKKKKASLSKQTIHAKVYVTYPVHEYLKYTYIIFKVFTYIYIFFPKIIPEAICEKGAFQSEGQHPLSTTTSNARSTWEGWMFSAQWQLWVSCQLHQPQNFKMTGANITDLFSIKSIVSTSQLVSHLILTASATWYWCYCGFTDGEPKTQKVE